MEVYRARDTRLGREVALKDLAIFETSTFVCRAATFHWGGRMQPESSRLSAAVSSLPDSRNVQSDFTSSSFDEPTVMWRMQRPDGRRSHLVLGRETDVIWGVWFLNETPLGIRDFSDLASAVEWADRMQAQNWSTGWRLEPDEHD